MQLHLQNRPGPSALGSLWVCTYLGFRVDVDPVCLSLAVLWGTRPAPVFWPVVEIRIFRYICLLCPPDLRTRTKRAWALGPEPSRTRPCTKKDTTPVFSPALKWWLLWQGDTALDLPLAWDGAVCHFPASYSIPVWSDI